MPSARASLGLCAAQHRLYAVGGERKRHWYWPFASRYSHANEAYDPHTDGWYIRARVPTPRSSLGLTEVDDRLFAIGGMRKTGWFWPFIGHHPTDANEEHRPDLNAWVEATPLVGARESAGVTALYGDIYAVGGIADQGAAHPDAERLYVVSLFYVQRRL
jgi:hypothetical protein